MRLESWSGDRIESEEIEESPPIPEAHMEIPESWTPPAWEPELSSVEQDSTDESSPKEPIEDETVNKTDSKGGPLGGGFEGLGGGDISIQSPPGATDDPGATTDNPGAATDDPNTTDQPTGTSSAADDQSHSLANARDTDDARAKDGSVPPEGAPPIDDGNTVTPKADDEETQRFLKELDALRRQQDKELKADLEVFKKRPLPPWMEAQATGSDDLAASKEAIVPLAPEVVADIRKQIAEESPIDYDNLKFEFGSPHEEYELAKDLAAAQRRTEVGRAANTADSLPDAILSTLKAAKEAKGEIDKDTAAMDEWMLLRYGPAPYTTNAYPEQEDDPDLADEKTDET